MSKQYFCRNKKRREAVKAADSKLNGIDYLEVLDSEAPEGIPVQQTLLVHFFKEITDLSAENVRVVGGVRVKSIKILWAYPASKIKQVPVSPKKGFSQKDKDFFSKVPDRDRKNILVVRVDPYGDYSTYTLHLTTSASDPNPPDGFDPQLSLTEFSFKVECASDFDCKQTQVCPPEQYPEPRIDYLAKDYSSFRRLILDRLALIMPDWRERNAADIGMALLEVMAYAGDQLSYYQDAVATEAYLGTARQRISVRRHARLLDYYMSEGNNARAWVCFEVDSDGIRLDERTQLLTRVNAPRGSLHPNNLDSALSQGATVLETLHPITLRKAHNEMYFYTWGNEECCLPKGATRAILKNDPPLELQAGDVLIFEERRSPTGLDPDPTHRHPVRLKNVKRTVDRLNNNPLLEIEWYPEDMLPFPLCLSAVITDKKGANVVPDLCVAVGNIALADHGRTLLQEELTEVARDEKRYRPILKRKGITHVVPYNDKLAREQSAAQTLIQDQRKVLPSIRIDEDGGTWTPVRDLLESSRFDKHFVVEMGADGSAQLRFGDNIFGKSPISGSALKANYRVGNGREGSVGADTIAHVVRRENDIRNVRNPLPAQGARDPEPLERVRLDAPEAFRFQERAVTPEDYADVAERHPEVQKAMGTLRWTGSWHTMFVTVDRKGGRPVDRDFEEEMRAFLEQYRLAGHDLEIESPYFVPLEIAVTVCVRPGYFRDLVKRALFEVFSSVDLPDGRRGLFHPDNFTFGQPVYLSRIIAAAMQVPGVLWIDSEDTPTKRNRFRRLGQPSHGEWKAGLIEMRRLEIARLDNDPNAPENGKIDFYMQGGL